MDAPTPEFALAGSLAELRAKGRLVVRGGHRPILVVYDRGRVFALDHRCPHMGFPLDRGSVDDGILTCHWHHARFDLKSVTAPHSEPYFFVIRLKSFSADVQRPAPSHVPQHAPSSLRRRFPDLASRDGSISPSWAFQIARGEIEFP